MSSTEFHKGKAKKIDFKEGLSLQEKVDEMKARGFEFDYCDIEMNEDGTVDYADIGGPKFVRIYGTDDFYELFDYFKDYDSDQNISQASLNNDGSIDFMLQFYNGGCSFSEAFESAISKITPKEAPLTQEQKSSNSDAYWRGDQEGWGYAVMDYTDGQEYLDPKTRELWKKAGDALYELENYLKQFKSEEF